MKRDVMATRANTHNRDVIRLTLGCSPAMGGLKHGLGLVRVSANGMIRVTLPVPGQTEGGPRSEPRGRQARRAPLPQPSGHRASAQAQSQKVSQ